ncbi:MAG TPA: SCO family protein [Polyangia bacterium]
MTKAATRAAELAARRRRRRARSGRRAALVMALALAALVPLAVAAWLWRATRPRAEIPVGAPLPELTLVDDRGATITRASLGGHAVVFSFAFLHDAMHAPATLAAVRALADDVRAGPAGDRVRIVTLTLAPDEDTPDHLRAAATAIGAESPWIVAGGASDEVDPLLDALDVDWHRLQSERAKFGAPIFAENRLVLVDGSGRLRGEYDVGSWIELRRLRGELLRVASE